MGVKEIVDRIRSETENKVNEITGRAEKEAEVILSDGEDKAKNIIDEKKASAEVDAEKLFNQKLTFAKIEFRKEKLREKNKLMDIAIEKGIKNCKKDERYEALVIRNFESALEELEGKEGKEDIEIEIEIVLPKKENMLDSNSRSKGLKISREDIAGGFIIKTPGCEYDGTLESLVESRRSSIEQELGKMLFSIVLI